MAATVVFLLVKLWDPTTGALGGTPGGRSHLAMAVIQAHPVVGSIVPTASHPFLAVEWNSGRDGSKMNVENQATRTGTAMVWARRQLRYLATGSYGQPTEYICFSPTADPNIGIVWVRWCDSGSCYMKRVKEVVLRETDAVRILATLIANIIDWGLSVRLEEIRGDLNTLVREALSEWNTRQKKWEGTERVGKRDVFEQEGQEGEKNGQEGEFTGAGGRTGGMRGKD
ncbi:MAG: hypothetical protein M1813_002054 [Trichoglossum hirsutum]|nr:MAG: hypothetical protein M1813_002054 [Trichoglossum hirsutum]